MTKRASHCVLFLSALLALSASLSACDRIDEILDSPRPNNTPSPPQGKPVPLLPVGPPSLNIAGTPNFGERTIGATFAPDPLTVEVNSGGPFQVREANIGNCTGFVTARPDFVLNVSTAIPFVRIFMEADAGDTTLVIHHPSGRWSCNDDTYETNPSVELEQMQPGRYAIWVGSYSAGATVHGSLTITASRTRIPGGEMPVLDIEGLPNFNAYNLRARFVPNPVSVDVVAGGPIQARLAVAGSASRMDMNSTVMRGGCVGWIALRPDINFTLAAAENGLHVEVSEVENNVDTTLVVLGPDGQWSCDDDSEDNRPAIDFQAGIAGTYHVWVGSYGQGAQTNARVEISRSASTRTTRPIRPRGQKFSH